MAVGVRVGNITDEIGSPSFLHSFFSTISRYGEPNGWGTGYPCLTRELYHGRLPAHSVAQALQELSAAKTVLSAHPPSDVIWDIEDLSARPPWGDNISNTITNLGNYFVTSTGRDLFLVLEECLSEAAESGQDVSIE
jgi:2,3-bisphosphoglycerate-dependent phosphoglycerate mutase